MAELPGAAQIGAASDIVERLRKMT